MGVRENKVERCLDTMVRALMSLTRKWVSPGRDGVPDRIVVHKRTVAEMITKLQRMHPDDPFADIYLVEIKTDDGKLSVAQMREHERLIKAGAQVRCVWGEKDVKRFVAEELMNA